MVNIPAQSSSSVSSCVVSSGFQQQTVDLGEKITGLTAQNFLKKHRVKKPENQEFEMNERLRAQKCYTTKYCVVICNPPSTQLMEDMFLVTLIFFIILELIYLKTCHNPPGTGAKDCLLRLLSSLSFSRKKIGFIAIAENWNEKRITLMAETIS